MESYRQYERPKDDPNIFGDATALPDFLFAVSTHRRLGGPITKHRRCGPFSRAESTGSRKQLENERQGWNGQLDGHLKNSSWPGPADGKSQDSHHGSKLSLALADARPQPRSYSFLEDFPREIRDMIYDCALDYPDSISLYARCYRQIEANISRRSYGGPAPYPCYDGCFFTPTILLLCRQITQEGLATLRPRPLMINKLPPWVFGARKPMSLRQFVPRRTLQSIRRLDIRIPFGHGAGSGWAWTAFIRELCDTLAENNSFEQLKVTHLLCDMHKNRMWPDELREFVAIRRMILLLRFGNPGNVWQAGEVVEETWIVDGSTAVKRNVMMATAQPEGPVRALYPPPADYMCNSCLQRTEPYRCTCCLLRLMGLDVETLALETRHYPDLLIWPGSIFEFV